MKRNNHDVTFRTRRKNDDVINITYVLLYRQGGNVNTAHFHRHVNTITLLPSHQSTVHARTSPYCHDNTFINEHL